VHLAGTSKNTGLQLPPICFYLHTLGGLKFDGRQHRRLGEQQQEQQQPLLRPARSSGQHGEPVRSRFTAASAGDSAQGRHFLLSMAAPRFFLDTFVPLGYVVSFCIHLSLLTLITECNVLLPILASCRWLTHKGHNFQGAHAASYT
jgi:hypothetical protein